MPCSGIKALKLTHFLILLSGSSHATISNQASALLKRIFDNLIPPSGGARFPALDGLRGLAVAGVICLHYFAIFYPKGSYLHETLCRLGSTSVCIFFALSAFLLFYPWAAGKTVKVNHYYLRRFFRIMPAYLIAVAVAIPLSHHPQKIQSILPHLFFIHSWRETWYLALPHIGPTWSLGTEVQFYLLLPVLAWLVTRKSIAFSLFALAIGCQLIFPVKDISLWMNLPVLLLPFLAGMATAKLVAVRWSNYQLLLAPLGLILFAAIILLPIQLANSSWLTLLFNARGLLASVACLLMIWGLASQTSTVARLLSSAPLRLAGVCGYGSFLFHQSARGVLLLLLHNNAALSVILGLPLTAFIALGSYLLIEAPAMRLARKPIVLPFRRASQRLTTTP